MSDLQRLIEAVEQGEGHEVALFAKRLASAARDSGESFPSYDVENAFRGNLNAAKALHEALLPGWHVANLGEVVGFNTGCLTGEWACRLAGFGPSQGCHATALNPARAWLLAILRAVDAKGGMA